VEKQSFGGKGSVSLAEKVSVQLKWTVAPNSPPLMSLLEKQSLLSKKGLRNKFYLSHKLEAIENRY
jgi:hypothetical protein